MSRLAHFVPLGLLAFGCGSGGTATPDAPIVLIDASPPDASPRELIMEGLLLAPGEITEGIMTGGNVDLALIHLSAPAAEIDWNIHGHANGGTQLVYEEYDKSIVDFTFSPAAQADWYLLIRNSGPTDMTIQLKVGLYGTMLWRWQ
jgi:hypothetical protein